MTSARDVILDQPSMRQLSLIPASREISADALEHARQSQMSNVYPRNSMAGGLDVTGTRRETMGYLQREPDFVGNHNNLSEEPIRGSPIGMDGPRRGSMMGLEGPRRASLLANEGLRRGSLRGLDGLRKGSITGGETTSRRGSVITAQPGYNSSAALEKSGSFLSNDSSIMDATFAREMAGLGLYDVIRIQQQMEIDLKGGCGHGNSYEITSIDGAKIFTAAEDSNCFCRWVCGPSRMTHITVYDNDDQPVLHFDRACCRCDCCCCFSGCCMCGHRLTIRDARGRVIGTIKEKFHVFQLRLHLEDSEGNVAMQVLGPCCPLRCCSEMTFDIMNSTGLKEIGYILKKWDDNVIPEGGQVDTDHENVEITMPQHGNVEERVLVLGATMLASLMYMEMS